jgi:hypothetical protein
MTGESNTPTNKGIFKHFNLLLSNESIDKTGIERKRRSAGAVKVR